MNLIRARALNHDIFIRFCDQMESEHTVFFYHTNVQWLSGCLVLSRFFELLVEIEIFLQELKFRLSIQFGNDKFIGALAYLANSFFNFKSAKSANACKECKRY